jgi:outer membrane murein-binding lipoprotein Lpp
MSLTGLLIFTIPILGILLAGYKEWLKFRTKQQELGASTDDVAEEVEALRARLDRVEDERDALRKRIQNLETIVTSEAWDALQDPEAAPPVLDGPADRDSSPSREDPSVQAEDLARRLRG